MVIVSKMLQNKFLDKDKMKRNKERMKKKQAKIKLLMKDDKKEEAGELQKEIMADTMEMMKGTQKMMVVSLPLIIVYFILGALYAGVTFESLFAIPTFTWYGFIPFPDGGFSIMTGWRRAYFVYYFGWFIIIGIIMKVKEKIIDSEIKDKSKWKGKEEKSEING
ncbi:MAG: DUF106 domain-containing protein [Candidatus Diapherotrites archaeon]|uniref:DUF106 domain-containing protein n=1 Tax=Candidatus Iainarchaeum sp. TaxID=3101447 RepID=A0A8T5GFL7_9ARCH|nr:DUF106 domain-containing protein [Candidatus Diapherotrites archaeon]